MRIFTKTYELPGDVKGFVVEWPDGDATIVINSLLSLEEQKRSLEHELEHLKNHDFEKVNADMIELERSCQ